MWSYTDSARLLSVVDGQRERHCEQMNQNHGGRRRGEADDVRTYVAPGRWVAALRHMAVVAVGMRVRQAFLRFALWDGEHCIQITGEPWLRESVVEVSVAFDWLLISVIAEVFEFARHVAPLASLGIVTFLHAYRRFVVDAAPSVSRAGESS